MLTSKEKFYFWLPTEIWPDPIPESIEKFISRKGYDSWIVQTYLRLKKAGIDCVKTDNIPAKGIIVAYRDFLPLSYRPNPDQFLVCVKADKNPHPYAQIHITHNQSELTRPNLQIYSISPDEYYLLWGPKYYIPHWPQPNLVPRNPERGNPIKNVAYYGSPFNLAPELKSLDWTHYVNSLGLNWIVEQRRECWHDYKEVDVILAVRNFSSKTDYPWKPASKLFNSWRAGVPAILGKESAFQSIRKNSLDYLEVGSYEESKSALRQLCEDTDLYREVINNGFQRASEVEIDAIVKQWDFFCMMLQFLLLGNGNLKPL